MARTKPYQGTSHDRLTALINADNGASLHEGTNFTIGTPTVSSGPAGRNTAITFTPVNFHIYQPQTLRYKRLSLAVLSSLAVGEILPVTITAIPFTTHSILSVINEALGLNLTTDEVLNEQFTTVEQTYRIKIKDNVSSLAWIDSEFSYVAQHEFSRLLEDGTPRLMEDGSLRLMETA